MADFPSASGPDPASGSTAGALPPAGWYPDPQQPSLLRWWDGTNWTHDQVDPRVPTFSSTPGAPWSTDVTDPISIAPISIAPISIAPISIDQTEPSAPQRSADGPGGSRRVAVLLAVVAFLAVIGIGVYVVDRLRIDDPVDAAVSETEGTTPEGESTSTAPTPAVDDVEVGGEPLPLLPNGDIDAAVGMPAPTLQGFDLAGNAMAIPDDGRPKAIYFLAHWCPHCQVELPKIIDLVESGALPAELDIYLVSTAVDESRGNYPPAAWLEAEGWTEPVLDDSLSAAAFQAFGGTGFPFAVYVGADNRVLLRTSGETPPELISEIWGATALTG